MNRPTAVIFDMDGTLCDVTSIRHLVDAKDPRYPGPGGFDTFHRRSVDCPPNQWVVDAARNAHNDGHVVYIVSARTEKYRPLTSWWLSETRVPYRALHMRYTWDQRPDHLVKADILARIQHTHDVIGAWDDRPSVINMWRACGIPTIKVPGWPMRHISTPQHTKEQR